MELQSYSILDRAIERTVLPTCQPVWHGSDGVEPRSKGMLTGKYRRGQPTPDTLRAMRFPKMVSDTRTLEVVDQLVPLAQDAGL